MAAEITGSGSGTSSGLSKVTFVLSWKTSGTSFAGSSRGDGASGKFPSHDPELTNLNTLCLNHAVILPCNQSNLNLNQS